MGLCQNNKNSIFTDIVQTGGGEVNPISKIFYEIIFWQKEEKEGVQTYYCMINLWKIVSVKSFLEHSFSVIFII